MGKILQFQSCAVGGEYTSMAGGQTTAYHYIGIAPPASIQAQIDASYKGTNLEGLVTGVGYGWQKYVVPSSGKATFVVRGAAGGCSSPSNFNVDPVTGNVISGSGIKPGRGAKLTGQVNLKKGDVLYILVGMRGFSPPPSGNWGAGGGGASVVLRLNPAGAYTFAPENVKVDVLFVAGGGAGNRYYNGGTVAGRDNGGDAYLTNGTTTNGGTSSGSSGGAGLTGNGGQGSQGSIARSILSGTPTVTSLNTANYGGWGGGGSGWYGGGGGGGFSGGNAVDSSGGWGGTSYINPNYCIEIARGYATVADDSTRRCSNPWSAYGFVEIEIGRAETKYILAVDTDGYKYFNGSENLHGNTIPGASNEWQLLPDQSNITDEIYAMYGARLITNVTGLQNKVKFLVSSPEPNETIYIDGFVAHSVIKMKNDVSMADVSTLKSITATTKLAGTMTKFAVSKDYGVTWQTYANGSWTDIDISDPINFRDNGYDMSFFSAIPLTDWQAYKAKTIRFAFCITQNADTGTNPILSAINYVADLVGSWKHFSDSQASYEYITDDTVEITFKEAGNYKVNYLDSLNPGGNN